MAHASPEARACPHGIKIEFSYLNSNLVVLTIHPLTLSFGCNGGFDDNLIPPSLPHVSKQAEEGQCTCQENRNE